MGCDASAVCSVGADYGDERDTRREHETRPGPGPPAAHNIPAARQTALCLCGEPRRRIMMRNQRGHYSSGLYRQKTTGGLAAALPYTALRAGAGAGSGLKVGGELGGGWSGGR